MLYSTTLLSFNPKNKIDENKSAFLTENGDFDINCHKYNSCISFNNKELKRAWKLYLGIHQKSFSSMSSSIESLLFYLESVMSCFETWFKKNSLSKHMKLNRLIHSEDFRSLIFKEKPYTLTESQSIVIRYLYENFLQGTKQLKSDTVISHLEETRGTKTSNTRLVHVFQKNKQAYKDLISIGSINGTVKINI